MRRWPHLVAPRRLAPLVAVAALLALGAPASGVAARNDPVYVEGLQWGLERIGTPAAWDRGTGEGITIAVVDSGVDLAHAELRDRLAGHISCIGAAGDPRACRGSGQDDNGHGTHVAGIALAATGNEQGVASVAPDARLLAVRVLANECTGGSCTATGTASDVAAGIRWAVAAGADVVNLSLGGGAIQATLGCAFCDAIEEAWAAGVIPVVAAGNESILPAGFDDEPAVIVTATTRDDTRASYSNTSSGLVRSARWAVAAPGGEGETEADDCAPGGAPQGILSTYWIAGQRDAYACLAGTSMAAPHVSGALAVLRGLGYGPQQAIDRLLGTSEDLGAPGRDAVFGTGRIDLARAVGPGSASTTSSTAPPPTDTAGAPTTVGSSSATTTTPPPGGSEPPAAPEPTLPGTDQAAPFDAGSGRPQDPPGWLVAAAVAALLSSGAATASVAWRLSDPTRR